MKLFFLIAVVFPLLSVAQVTIKGQVLEENTQLKTTPLLGANVYWESTSVGTTTDFDGNFELPYRNTYKNLIISYIGYKTDTIAVPTAKFITHVLKPSSTLEEVTITSRKQATIKSYTKPTNTITVSSKELLKAACCNLSESFETNPSIDVNFADAVTGTKQIKMLGLTSPYLLITTENIPSVRGASQAYGLSFIPGTWVESIQITKGAGSVVNGFESIAGQINAELVKPTTDKKLFVNLFGASNNRLELNTHLNTAITKNWATGLYVHGSSNSKKHDVNNDGFLDMPKYKQINIMNRWQYTNASKGLVSFFNFNYLNDQKLTGQLDFSPKTDKGTTNSWGSEIHTNRYDVSSKFGYVDPEIPYRSLGLQVAYSSHNQDSYFGLNTYTIQHKSLYTNLIYNSIIGDSRSKFKTGITFTNDTYNEQVTTNYFKRKETNLGAFFEYAFDNLENLNLTAGFRVDTNNLLGTFITPRFHIRYTPWEKSALRASFGRGKRSANIFTENQNVFATSRSIHILNTEGKIYGLNPEIAWNYGISYLQGFLLFNKKADVTVDFYRTNFTNQVVVDYENSTEVNFYNLNGKSFSNSLQIEVNYHPVNRLDLRLAYKYYDVQTQYNSRKLEKPLIPKHRFFANIAYETPIPEGKKGNWKFDATYNWLDKQRFSSTEENPIAFQLPKYTPTVATLNAQITKVFSPTFELYFGGENITNFKQKKPILEANNPFGAYFDTTFVYGPIFGSTYYAGLRFTLE